MLKAEQIPDEVVQAAREAWLRSDVNATEDWRVAVVAALNAWPRMSTGPNIYGRQDAVMHLPLPQEKQNAEG